MFKDRQFKIRIIIVVQILLGYFYTYANESENTSKPTITNEMCAKLWYGCQRYELARTMFYYSVRAKGLIESDGLMEKMKNGDKVIAEKFIRSIQKSYGRQDSWANFKLFGFNYEELRKTDALYSYYKEENKRLEKEKERLEKEKQEQQYKKWCEEGIPPYNVKPSREADLFCKDPESLLSFLNNNPEILDCDKYTFDLWIESDKEMKLINVYQPYGDTLFSHLNLGIEEPAFFALDKINKEIPIGSIIQLKLSRDLSTIKSGNYRDEFEASTKYDKKNDKWSIKLTKESAMALEGDDDKIEKYIMALENALRKDGKTKKYVKFKLYDVKVSLYYDKDKPYLFREYLDPIAEITGSQSAFSRFQRR